MKVPIVKIPEKVLITPAKKVQKLDHKIARIISDMKDALKNAQNPKGVGIAAPQIGVSLQIFLMWDDEQKPMRVFINPQIIHKSKAMLEKIPGKDEDRIEGCLSVPAIWGTVRRHKEVTLEFMDENGAIQTEKFTDFPAVIAQHEVDHLNGILYTMRVIEQKGQLYQLGTDKYGKEVLEPIDV